MCCSGRPKAAAAEHHVRRALKRRRHVFITKLDAARRQLRTAIELWFAGGDPVSILTLAHASHEIIHRFYRRKGLSSLLYDSHALTDEQRKRFTLSLKEGANFIKHANQAGELDEKIFINFASTNDLFLIMSTVALLRMRVKLNATESNFAVWLFVHNPGWFAGQKSINDRIPPDRLKELRKVETSKFLDAFQKLRREFGVG
jgi:hypothetical protein